MKIHEYNQMMKYLTRPKPTNKERADVLQWIDYNNAKFGTEAQHKKYKKKYATVANKYDESEDPRYIDPKEMLDIKKAIPVSPMVKKDKKWKFTQDEVLQATALRIKEKPNLSQIGLLRIPKEWGFDPLEKWELEFTVNEKIAKGIFSLSYDLPKQLITGDPLALEDAGLRPIKTAFLGLIRESKLSGWQSEWAQQDYSIIFLCLLLIILTLLLIFQKKLSASRKIHSYIRLGFLTIILTWMGWIAQAQLSIVNIISYVQALVQGKGYTQFLFEPLMCIIFVYTVVSLILLGRGVFCGWLCPFGALQEILFKLGRLIKLPQINIPFWLNERLWAVSYTHLRAHET